MVLVKTFQQYCSLLFYFFSCVVSVIFLFIIWLRKYMFWMEQICHHLRKKCPVAAGCYHRGLGFLVWLSKYEKWYSHCMAQAYHSSKLLLSFKILDFVDFFLQFFSFYVLPLFDLLLQNVNFSSKGRGFFFLTLFHNSAKLQGFGMYLQLFTLHSRTYQ